MFACGSLFFYSIWLIYGKNTFPWFIFPVAAWAGGFIFHFFKAGSVTTSAPIPTQYAETVWIADTI